MGHIIMKWGLGIVELDGEGCVGLGRERLKGLGFKSGARVWAY